MEITARTIIFAIISIILIVAILGGVFYLLKNSKQLNINNKSISLPNSLSKLQVVSTSPTPTPSGVVSTRQNPTVAPVVSSGDTKAYQGQGFVLRYPAVWGLLTCSDSQNIEFDPYNKNDLKNYSCDRAIKPITVIVNSQPINCPGETIKIGNNTIIKSKTETANWLKNRWCINKNGMSFDITNRINSSGIIGTGKDDFSKQIEQIISSL